jgi:hypothetical protein
MIWIFDSLLLELLVIDLHNKYERDFMGLIWPNKRTDCLRLTWAGESHKTVLLHLFFKLLRNQTWDNKLLGFLSLPKTKFPIDNKLNNHQKHVQPYVWPQGLTEMFSNFDVWIANNLDSKSEKILMQPTCPSKSPSLKQVDLIKL